jgi:hypothetical protein
MNRHQSEIDRHGQWGRMAMNRFLEVRLEVSEDVAPSSEAELRIAAELIAKAVSKHVRVIGVGYREKFETIDSLSNSIWSVQSGLQDIHSAVAEVHESLPEVLAVVSSVADRLKALGPLAVTQAHNDESKR